jgi:hypothetical protein
MRRARSAEKSADEDGARSRDGGRAVDEVLKFQQL